MHSSKDSPMASSIECARDDGSSDPDEWASGDPETAKAMVIYLLDELQPQLWTKRKDAISTFFGYFFRTNPVLCDSDVEVRALPCRSALASALSVTTTTGVANRRRSM